MYKLHILWYCQYLKISITLAHKDFVVKIGVDGVLDSIEKWNFILRCKFYHSLTAHC